MTIPSISDHDLAEGQLLGCNAFDYEYHQLLEDILEFGEDRGDRTGTGTRSLFGESLKFDMRDGSFPLLTTKKIYWKAVVSELLWLISGETNIGPMLDDGVHIWDEWTPAYKEGGKETVEKYYAENPRHEMLDLGPVYGAQWRNFGGGEADNGIDPPIWLSGTDQLASVIERIKTNPECRRLIVSAWNPAVIDKMGLPPCHTLFQFYVSQGEFLDCQMYQRSADVFLGVPFNIASYCLLTHMIAHVTGLKPGTFTHVFGDVHIYNNHFDQVKEQLSREGFEAPTLSLNPDISNIDDFKFDDINLEGYESHPAIKAPVSV